MPHSPAVLQSRANATAIARSRAVMCEQERTFRALEANALRHEAGGEDLAAAVWAQTAYRYGWAMPGGRLAAPALERLLNELGRKHAGGGVRRDRRGDVERVLHVATECYPIGGHTRVLQRWLERDPRGSTVVLTGQRTPVPAGLVAAVDSRDATLVNGLAGADLFDRARELRVLAAEHDLVVLHVHMHDVLPALAFADPDGRPPTVFFDHACHQLWAGLGATDVLACFRDIEARIAVERRAVDPRRIRLLPLPVSERALPQRAAARRSLGLDPEAPVLVAIASDWKVRPVIEPTFPEIAEAALARCPDAVVLAIGPVAGQSWAEAVGRSGGRVRPLGPVPDIAPHLAAADVMLDSWPASGATAILDAAAAGLPILTFDDGHPDMAITRANEPLLRPGILRAASLGELSACAAELAGNPGRRQSIGDQLRAAAEQGHGGGWARFLEDVVAAAVELAGTAEVPPPRDDVPPATWQCVLQLLLNDQQVLSPHAAAAIHAAELPPRLRPASRDELIATVDAVLADRRPSGRRAVAAPPLEPATIQDLVERLRRLSSSGDVDACAVVIPPDRLAEGLALLQAALDKGDDVEIDVVPADSLAAVATPSDVVLELPRAAA